MQPSEHTRPTQATPCAAATGTSPDRVRPPTPMLHYTLALVLFTAGLVGCADPAPRSDAISLAAVQAVYVEVAADIYVSESLLATPAAHDYWVKVALSADPGQSITTMARVPATLVLAAGDTVSVALAPPLLGDDGLNINRRHRVLDVISSGALAQAGPPALPTALAHFLAPDAH